MVCACLLSVGTGHFPCSFLHVWLTWSMNQVIFEMCFWLSCHVSPPNFAVPIWNVFVTGCCVFCLILQRQYFHFMLSRCQQKERVIHLTFIGVRRRARKLQMGRYLLSVSTATTWDNHSCQPLLGVNLSPEFVNRGFLGFPGVFCFFAGSSSFLNSNWHAWQWKEEAVLC